MRIPLKMKKKLFALILTTILLAGCNAGGAKRKKKSSDTDNIVTSVRFNREELNFNLNEEHRYTVETLYATVDGKGDFDKTLKWSTSNADVAKVENGVVNAVGLGDATITAVSVSNKEAYATCAVNVINDIPVISSVSITPENPVIDLYTSASIQLTAIVSGTNNPSQQVTWDAQNNGVLSVDTNGLVTANQVGLATVTATSSKDTSKSATVTVSVVNSTPTVDSVEIQPTASSYTLDLFTAGQKTKQFTANVSVTNGASKEVTWESSDLNKVSVDQTGLVTALQVTVSPVTITARSKFDTSKTDTVRIVVNDSTPSVSQVSVSLNSTVKVGSTTTAVATVIGKNISADQKKVTWSSSNPSIAQVDQNTGVVTGKLVGGPVTITATSTFDNKISGYASIRVVEPGATDDYTILLYLCGSDLESNDSFATADLKEIVSSGATPEGVNFIIETGGAKSWSKDSREVTSDGNTIPTTLTTWFVNSNGKLEKTTTQPDDTAMSYKSTFKSFLEWGLATYPADKTAVILWNHGGGMEGCCFDERKTEAYLTPSDLYSALKEVLGTGSNAKKLEWIGYDCCTMQMADIASTNADYFHYQIASQELEAGEGWVYSEWTTMLYNSVKNNTPLETGDLLKVICDDFVESYNATLAEEGYPLSDNDQVLSYLKLDNMQTFTDAFNEFTSGYNNETSYDKVVSASKKVLRFSELSGQSVGDVDMRALLLQLGASNSSAVVQAFDNIIGYHSYYSGATVYQTNKPSGLNAFVAFEPSGYFITVPKDVYNCTSSVYSTKFETWCNMNREYGTFYESWW